MPLMKLTRCVVAAVLGSRLLGGLGGCGGAAKRLEAENEALRAQLTELAGRAEAETQASAARTVKVKRWQAEAQDVLRLRAEKISMKLVDGEWKFGGYIREPSP